MTDTTRPSSLRGLDTGPSRTLAGLAAIQDDLYTVLRCCERLVAELGKPADAADDLLLEALWTTALLSYGRCFTAGRGDAVLTEDDVRGTRLQGEVTAWHATLRKLRKHYADPAANPRERFSVGAAQDAGGQVEGIAITSVPQPRLDEATVRQTGALAYELSTLVERRMSEQQERVAADAGAMDREALDRLPVVSLAPTDEAG